VPIREGVFGWRATANEGLGVGDEPEGMPARLNRIAGEWHALILQLFDQSGHIIKTSLPDQIPAKGWRLRIGQVGQWQHPAVTRLCDLAVSLQPR